MLGSDLYCLVLRNSFTQMLHWEELTTAKLANITAALVFRWFT